MENKSWINHLEWAVVLVTLIGGFYAMDARIDAGNARADAINARFDQFMFAWQQESKDFHGRLVSLEERSSK
jgi:hypothetical protein